MIKPKFIGKILKGRLVYINNKRLTKYLQTFKDEQEVEVVISKKYKKRTSGQANEDTNFNAYYWGVIIKMIADEVGEFDQDGYNRIHYMLQVNVNNMIAMRNGTEVPAGTRRMSGMEFSEYCAKCRMWANQPDNISDNGIFIPKPNEIEY